jgi:hypothetical protein
VDDRQHTGFFDAHTHWPGGILPWKAFIKMLPSFQSEADQAVVDRATPTQEDYVRLVTMYETLFVKTKTLLETGPLRTSGRVSNACRAIVRSPIPAAGNTPESKTAKLQWLEIALRRLLTSSVRTEYDSAYAIRGEIIDEYVQNNPAHKANLLDWLLLESAKGDITYSEQSASRRAIAQDYTPTAMAAASTRIRSKLAGKPVPDVRFLVQFTTPMLSQVGPANEDRWQIATPNGVATVPAHGAVRANAELMTSLTSPTSPLLQANVAGVDVLSPEKNSFTSQGVENFKQLVKAVFTQAIAENRRMVVHVHVGEGFPLAAEEHGITSASLEAPPPAIVTDRDGMPLHYKYAEGNVQKLIQAVDELRKDPSIPRLAELDNFVVIRFGHVSHATREDAKRMFALHIWADVNLTSNIATGTLYLDRPDLSKPNTLKYFRDHALISMMAEGVSVVFGTDGPGVEHVRMSQELVIAQDIFANVGAVVDKRGAAMAGKSRQYVDEMLRLATEHVKFMGTPPRISR